MNNRLSKRVPSVIPNSKDRKSYKLAVDAWGDITAERRQKEGDKAFDKIKALWNEDE